MTRRFFRGRRGYPVTKIAVTAVVTLAVLTFSVRSTAATILFDEAHHNLHGSSGRYRELVEALVEAGFAVEVNHVGFNPSGLAGFKVLLIPVARSAGNDAPMEDRFRPAFSETEVEAVHRWVSEGGGLLLFTDHQPTAGAARPLAGRFEIDMSNGFTADPSQGRSGAEDDWAAFGFHLVFERQAGSLADHPITLGRNPDERIERVGTFTGQSLAGPPGSVSLLRLGPDAVDWYLQPKGGSWQRPSPSRDRSESAAGRSQALALEVGKGRAVILGEAAIFTVLGIGADATGADGAPIDNRQFALNIVRWLAGQLH